MDSRALLLGIALLCGICGGPAAADELFFQCDGVWQQNLVVKLVRPLFTEDRLQYLKEGNWTDFKVLSKSDAAITVSSEGWLYSNAVVKKENAISNEDSAGCGDDSNACYYDIRFDLLGAVAKGETGSNMSYVNVASRDCKQLVKQYFGGKCVTHPKGSTLESGICVRREKLR